MDDRKPIFYDEVEQANEDILSVVKGSLDKSPYFDFSETFQDYIKLIEALKKKYPLGPQGDQAIKKPSLSNNVNSVNSTTNNSFGNNLFSNSLANSSTGTTIFNANSSNNTFSAPQNQRDDNDKNGDEAEVEAEGEADDVPQSTLDIFEEAEYLYKARCKLYERTMGGGGGQANLLGCGSLYIKDLGSPTKLHIVVRKDPDFRTFILNQIFTSTTPLKSIPKAVQMIFPDADGKTKCYIAKVKDEQTASELYKQLQSVKNA